MNCKQRRLEKKLGSPVVQGPRPAFQGLFADAVHHHQAGRLSEAERCCRQVLAADPRHADSLHLLGIVAYQTGHHDPALDLILDPRSRPTAA